VPCLLPSVFDFLAEVVKWLCLFINTINQNHSFCGLLESISRFVVKLSLENFHAIL